LDHFLTEVVTAGFGHGFRFGTAGARLRDTFSIGLNRLGGCYILERHKADFSERGISEDQIPDAVMTTVIYGEFVRYQRQKEPRREIYKVSFNEQIHYIAVDIGDNGYIVDANPSSP
jgi:hypothetical protein